MASSIVPTAVPPPGPIPLVVDVDGTLVRSDILHETALLFAARHPLQLWRLPAWLGQGKAALKAELAERVDIDASTLPLRDETLAVIEAARAAGRPVYLASASPRGTVEALAARIGGIAGVFATGDGVNLAGEAKAKRLAEAFGERGFDYIGDRRADFAVWQVARKSLAVTHGDRFEAELGRRFPEADVLARPRVRARAWLETLRPHQWAKNLLVFVPLGIGHYFSASAVMAAMLAFVCFCLAASSAYLLNDLLDIPGDRRHAAKQLRPIPAGDLPIPLAIILSALLAAGAIGLSLALPLTFTLLLLGYCAATLAYSLVLKRYVLIDVVTLGGLYALRVLGGVEAIHAIRSPWLLMFSLFLFMALALVKRASELIAQERAGAQADTGRGYSPADLRVLLPSAAAAGHAAVLVAALYLSSADVRLLYHHPLRLWLVCPILLFWISRVLILCNRGTLHEDPVVFALTDRASGACAVATLLVVASAL